jgi:Domain of unknown function (DUF397)
MEQVDPCWRKSSYSGTSGGSCVELGQRARGVLVRDTTDRTGPVLTFPRDAWREFAARVKAAA